MAKIKRALISLSDKTGIVEFARELSLKWQVEILSTGGTADLLRKNGVPVKDVSEHTGFPEMLDGRVKTLHPKIHGGILGIRTNKEHIAQMEKHNIQPIDLVVVNLYPFEATISKPDCKFEDAIENIDIGGPTALRSAAKNFNFVTVVIDPADYNTVLDEMKTSGGEVSYETNRRLCAKVFDHTSRYDSLIANYLENKIEEAKGKTTSVFPEIINLRFAKYQDLRYGENPHQKGAFYREFRPVPGSVSTACQIQGKEMSFNNYLDANAALELTKEFTEPVSVVVKHNNPCGVSHGTSLCQAYIKAREVDPVSAFGGVLAFNRQVDADTAEEIVKTFVEIVIAPGFTKEALTLFTKKKDIRVLDIGSIPPDKIQDMDYKRVVGGMIAQERDLGMVDVKSCKVVSKRPPTDAELASLEFAWKVCKHVKSNAIIFAKNGTIVGIGAGQMSRVDSVKLAKIKSLTSTEGTVMASDAFFPFRDGIDAAKEAGITAVIQPGGSLRDDEVIKAADEYGIAMILTGMRHFRH